MTAFVNVPDKNMELNLCSQKPFFILFTPKIVSFDLTRESHDSNSASVSFNGENDHEAGSVKDFHDGLIDVCNSHAALLIYHLLRTKQHPQASGRDVILRTHYSLFPKFETTRKCRYVYCIGCSLRFQGKYISIIWFDIFLLI